MSLDNVMSMTVTVEDKTVSQPNFGTPLLFGYTTAWLDVLVKEYAAAGDMLTDGFLTTDALYQAALIVKSQSPCPDTFMIGRRITALTQTITVTPVINTVGFKYIGTVGGKAFSYTVTSGSGTMLTNIAIGIADAINALTVGVTATPVGTLVTIVNGTAGAVCDFNFGTTGAGANGTLVVTDVTTDSTTDAELPNIYADNPNWYGLLVIDSQSQATILRQASWTESVRRQSVAQTADTACLVSETTTDTMSELMDSSYLRTLCIYHRAIGGKEWLAAGWLAGALTTTPGSATMAFKAVAGVQFDVLQPSEEASIFAKNGNDYTNVGLPITYQGQSPGAQYGDITRFLDWTYATMRNDVLILLANNPKVPYTDTGADMVKSVIAGVIKQGQDAGGFATTPAATVTAPAVATVDPSLRAARILPDITWTATLAGAIHSLNPVTGIVSV
jgi:hypothetical protein